jgi:prepilin-type N-terminal cleavage/methylation domain-containing protein
MWGKRAAFTLLEVIVAVTVLAVLGAIVVPTAVGASEADRVRQTAADLLAIKAANDAYNLGGAKAQLGRISFASVQPQAGDTTSCNGLEPGGVVTVYTTAQAVTNYFGPYMNRANSKDGGFVTGIGIMNDRMVRTTASGTTGSMVITIPNVKLDEAKALNDFMETDSPNANLSNTAGLVQYSIPSASLLVDLTYRFPMQAKDC